MSRWDGVKWRERDSEDRGDRGSLASIVSRHVDLIKRPGILSSVTSERRDHNPKAGQLPI